MKKILIAGASGYLGRHLVEEYKRRGYFVRALVRSREKLINLATLPDEIIEGDVTEPDSIGGCCDGMDVAVSTVGITRQKDGYTYQDVDYLGNRNLLENAVSAGVEQFAYISVFGAEYFASTELVKAKNRFADELCASSIPHTIIYPVGFYSDLIAFLDMAKKGRGYLLGSGNNRLNPIHGRDLARFCIEAIQQKREKAEVGGPEVFTHEEILRLAFEVVGRKPRITRIPAWVSNLILWTMKRFTSVRTYGPIEFFLTAAKMEMVAPRYGDHKLRDYFYEKR